MGDRKNKLTFNNSKNNHVTITTTINWRDKNLRDEEND